MTKKGKKFLVTGGAGFIGSHLSRALIARGDNVIILDSLESGDIRNIEDIQGNPHLEFVEDTVLNKSRLLSLCSSIDGIFHLAALVSVQRSIDDPQLNHLINVDGMFNVLESARQQNVPKIVLASSAALYGNEYAPPHKETFPTVPLSPYAVGKNLSEMYSTVYSELYDIECVCLRFFNVYGPNQDPSSPYSGVISKFLDAITHGSNIVVFGDGEQTRDFVYVLDVVQALFLSMDEPIHGVLNVGTGISSSINQLARNVINLGDLNVEVVHKEKREGEVRHSCADITKIQKELGYNPVYSLEKGLIETYRWWLKGN
jgi:UDP-glucose 4-epimerase